MGEKEGPKHLVLEGLHCRDCASRVEMRVRGVKGVNNATVDFDTGRLTVQPCDANNWDGVLDEVRATVQEIEPGITMTVENTAGKAKANKQDGDDEGGENRRSTIIRLAAGGLIYAVAALFSFPHWVEHVLYLASYVIIGGDVVIRAAKNIVHGQIFTEHFLMSVATIGAFFVGEYSEGVAVMLFYSVGELLQDMAVDHSRRSIASLMNVRQDYANLKMAEGITRVAPEDVHIGDVIVVGPGERIPLDGEVIEGTSMVDTSALTGESVPRELKPGKTGLSGFININGMLTIKVTKDFDNSTASRILDLVQNAGSRKAPTEKFITTFARYYTPVVVFAALALAILPPLVVPGATFDEWIYRALIFLVISCPCALVISIPLGFFGGIGAASRTGILVKGGNYLEALSHVQTVVFDKTGTLTKGVFKVTEANPGNGFTAGQLMEFAAYAESYSSHPIALSILAAYGSDIDKSRITEYQEVAGNGIEATVAGKKVLAGNARLMQERGIDADDVDGLGTVVHVAVDHTYVGNIVISDEVKEDAARAVGELKSLGVQKTLMLTGDLKAVGDKIGKQLGLDEVYSDLLPADKVEKLESLEAGKPHGGKVVFVGDGINDAPVLVRADIGIAMGGLGSDAAVEAADVVIMTDEPSKIATAIRIAKRTRGIVMQNVVLALSVKALFLLLGATGEASMWEAVFADVGVTIIAVLNAMRAMAVKHSE